MKRSYIIPLRSAFGKKPRYKKTPTAVRAVKAFLIKHMKVDDVRLGKNLNMAIWANGIKNPPARVSVDVEKKDNVAYAELSGKVYDEPTKEDIEAAVKAQEKKNASKSEKKEAKTKSDSDKEETVKESNSDKKESNSDKIVKKVKKPAKTTKKTASKK